MPVEPLEEACALNTYLFSMLFASLKANRNLMCWLLFHLNTTLDFWNQNPTRSKSTFPNRSWPSVLVNVVHCLRLCGRNLCQLSIAYCSSFHTPRSLDQHERRTFQCCMPSISLSRFVLLKAQIYLFCTCDMPSTCFNANVFALPTHRSSLS